MNDELHPMNKFKNLIGSWKLEYKIPESIFSKEDCGEGTGEFKYILNGLYVSFDYEAVLKNNRSLAHAIFTWDKSKNNYRYWWFEESGQFMEATADFINNNTICLNWHNSLLIQTFSITEDGRIILRMKYPSDDKNYVTILKVTFTKIT